MERLKLPGDAGRLWRHVRETFRERLRRDRTTAPEYELGGGTILAARWGHRRSFDIDLTTTDPRGELAATARTGRGLAEALGGRLNPRSSVTHLTIELEEGRVDVTRARPAPAGEERIALVDGHHERVLATTQILYGKLKRAREVLARDVYDVTTAAAAAPSALTTACAVLTEYEAEAIARTWRAQNRRLEVQGPEKILPLHEDQEVHVDNLGLRGAETLLLHWRRSRTDEGTHLGRNPTATPRRLG